MADNPAGGISWGDPFTPAPLPNGVPHHPLEGGPSGVRPDPPALHQHGAGIFHVDGFCALFLV